MADPIDQEKQETNETSTTPQDVSNKILTDDSSATDNLQVKQDPNMTPDTPIQTQTTSSKSSPLIYITFVLSAGALALSGWQFYQASIEDYDSKLSRISQSNAKLETILAQQTQAVAQVEPIQSALSKVIPALKKLETDDQNTQENTAKLGAEITSVRKQLSRLKNTSKEDWKLAEAEYLVRLANQRLLMEKDIDGAEQLLVSADAILAEMKDPILFETRRALAKDIQALKSTRSFDLEGVYLQLDALSSQVNSLEQKEPSKLFSQAVSSDATNETVTPDDTSYAKAIAQDIWQTLRSLVVINYNNKPIKPLLPPTEYQQLITGIQLQVNVAQLALLKQESSVYQIALEHIANAVNEHFDIDSATVSGYLTSLTALQQVNVSPELPLPRASLTSMKDLMQNWNGTGKNTKLATQAPIETLGISQSQDIVAKPQAQDVPELVKVEPASQIINTVQNKAIENSALSASQNKEVPLEEELDKTSNEEISQPAEQATSSTENKLEPIETPQTATPAETMLTEELSTSDQETSL